jgi:hypothetical protein
MGSHYSVGTFITDWDAKFTYNFWRPVTAIRNGDMDGNDATERDPAWTPLNDTPMHPEYPLQAAIISGVAVGVLESVFGPKPAIPFTTADLFDPNLKRQFNSIAEMDEEHRNVRVWGGIHFRNSLMSAMTWVRRWPPTWSTIRSSRRRDRNGVPPSFSQPTARSTPNLR